MSQRAAAIASLQALDGRGDEAFATLQTVLEVSRKLEPSARTLVRFMIARVMQRLTLETAAFVLDTTPVSPAARARFAAALTGGSSGEAGARRMIAIEQAMLTGGFGGRAIGDIGIGMMYNKSALRRPLNAISPLLYNPNRTLNLYGELTTDLQEFAARREIEKFRPRFEAFQRDAIRFKNLLGGVFLGNAIPAYTKVTESYWLIEDLRGTLHRRLTA